MEKKFNVVIVGCGRFAKHFAPIFNAHPLVGKVYGCDLIREKSEEFREKFGIEIIDTYEDALAREDIDCVLNFTDRHLHGDIVKRALLAGKHVYSAVPMASSVEECQDIVELVKKTGLIYFMAETCYYYPSAMFAREAYKDGKLGDFVYGASQYYHHIDSIGYGKVPMEGGMPPLLYPTHSTGMILSVTDTFVKRVTCVGYKDNRGDERFKPENNHWGNESSSQFVLMELANGGVARVTESRCYGWRSPSSYVSAVYGTKGSYEFSNAQHILVERGIDPENPEKVRLTDVSDYVNPAEMVEHKNDPDFKQNVANGKWQWSSNSAIQANDVARLPKELEGIVSGHMGSHKFLVDDFLTAVKNNEQPILNAWRAARYTVPGLVAIESQKQGGIPLEVPEFPIPEGIN